MPRLNSSCRSLLWSAASPVATARTSKSDQRAGASTFFPSGRVSSLHDQALGRDAGNRVYRVCGLVLFADMMARIWCIGAGSVDRAGCGLSSLVILRELISVDDQKVSGIISRARGSKLGSESLTTQCGAARGGPFCSLLNGQSISPVTAVV